MHQDPSRKSDLEQAFFEAGHWGKRCSQTDSFALLAIFVILLELSYAFNLSKQHRQNFLNYFYQNSTIFWKFRFAQDVNRGRRYFWDTFLRTRRFDKWSDLIWGGHHSTHGLILVTHMMVCASRAEKEMLVFFFFFPSLLPWGAQRIPRECWVVVSGGWIRFPHPQNRTCSLNQLLFHFHFHYFKN